MEGLPRLFLGTVSAPFFFASSQRSRGPRRSDSFAKRANSRTGTKFDASRQVI